MSAVSETSSTRSPASRSMLPKPIFLIGLVLLASGSGFAIARLKEEPRAAGPAARESGSSKGPASSTDAPHVFAPPARPSAHRAAPFEPPSVSEALANAPELTLEIETRSSALPSATPQRKTVSRGAGRIHIRSGTNGPEWLFVRNPEDGRRMSATLVDHAHRTLVEYEEAELRSSGLGRGWADVAGFGVEPEAFAGLEATGRDRSMGGFQFSEARAKAEAKGRIRELWWSDEAAAPLSMTIGSGPTARQVVVRNLQRKVDPSLFEDLRRRYPGYSVMDVSDYREKHHDHGAEAAHDAQDADSKLSK